MFGHDSFVWTPVSVLGSENRVFNSGEPNIINIMSHRDGYYLVRYPEAAMTGTLLGKGSPTLALAIEDATSGTNSTSLTYRIDSYWEEGKTAAIAAGATDFPCYGGFCDATAEERTPPDCDGDGRKVNADGTCGICKDGYTEDANGDCIADCEDGYAVNEDNKCVAVSGNGEETEEGTNWMLYGGIAVVVIGGIFMMSRK